MFTLARDPVVYVTSSPTTQSWRLRVTATLSAGGAAAYIFVYQTAAAPVADQDFFSCVAGAPQMTELPTGSGAAGVPFYRTNTIQVYCRSATHARDLWHKLQRATQELADNLSLEGLLSSVEVVEVSQDGVQVVAPEEEVGGVLSYDDSPFTYDTAFVVCPEA